MASTSYLKNLGGNVLDAGLLVLARNARVILCGLINEYNAESGAVGSRNIWQLIVKSASMTGFLASDYAERFDKAFARLSHLACGI